MKREGRVNWLFGKRLSIVVVLLVLACIVGTTCVAQEESLNPEINKNYRDPNVEKSVSQFEKEGREIYAHREEIVAMLNLKPGMDVADIGAGTGFFARMFARKVAPDGMAYGVDISKNFVEHMDKVAAAESIKNMKGVLCDDKSTRLAAESVDVVFTCDTYHHFEYVYKTLESIHQALRPGGILVVIDFERVKGITPEKRCKHVRCGKGTATDEIKDAGFDFVEEIPMMKDQWIRKFKKRPVPTSKD